MNLLRTDDQSVPSESVAGDAGAAGPQVAINWTICKGALPIPGAKNAKQAREAAGGARCPPSTPLHLLLTPNDALAAVSIRMRCMQLRARSVHPGRITGVHPDTALVVQAGLGGE